MPNSNSTSWSKNTNDSNPSPATEDIIVPNEDVFDLHEYVNKPNPTEETPQNTFDSQINNPTQHESQAHNPSFISDINPENLRRSKEEKYFYQTDKNPKSKETSNWFIVTFLMTVVILGSLYFYFTLEDKNAQISGLERQLSNKADNRVKGVLEVKNDTANTSANTNSANLPTQPSTNITITPNSISSPNFTLSTDTKDLDLKVEKANVSINYLNNQVGSKISISKITNLNNGKTLRDSVEIYSAEKQADLGIDTIIDNVLKDKTDFISEEKEFKSKNNLTFSSLKSKNKDDNSKIYVGVSETYSYIIQTSNESFGNVSQNKINEFIKSIISNISFN